MTKKAVIRELEIHQLKKDIPRFCVGDTISVHTRIIEGGKERIQVFTGTVIARKGTGLNETFSVHRVAYGEGMERVFLLHSPRIAKIEVVKEGDVRRAKLYYLRGTTGKKARVKARLGASRNSKGSAKTKEAVAQAQEETASGEIAEEKELEAANVNIDNENIDSETANAERSEATESETEKADA